MNPDWKQLLFDAVQKSSITAVALKLDVSRTTISLVLANKYPAKTDKIATLVLDVYARLTCPHTGVEISHAECRKQATSDVPTSSPQSMRHWRACQGCKFKPQGKAQGEKP